MAAPDLAVSPERPAPRRPVPLSAGAWCALPACGLLAAGFLSPLLAVVGFLEAGCVTGQTMVVDGGQFVPESLEALASA